MLEYLQFHKLIINLIKKLVELHLFDKNYVCNFFHNDEIFTNLQLHLQQETIHKE